MCNADRPVLIVVAGGAGRRFGGDKLLAELDGKPVLVHTLERLGRAAKLAVLVVPAGREEEFRRLVAKYLPDLELRLATGGNTRAESVKRGVLAADPADDDLVAVHDAARPLATPELLAALCRRAREVGGAVPGFPQADAQKRVDDRGVITADLARDGIWNVGTPQVFTGKLIRRACQAADSSACLDDAEAVRRVGGSVAVVPCGEPNFKLTARSDLKLLAALMRR